MELKRHPLYYGGQMMPWAMGTTVTGAKGFVWVSGTEGRDPDSPEVKLMGEDRGLVTGVAEGAEAQSLMCWEKIKSGLEEMGSSLDNIIKITSYVVGPFPDGVVNHPTWLAHFKVREEFFRKHCPDLRADVNPPAHDLIGIAGLADKRMIIEIAVVAAVP